jgi:protein-L-isoaspartate(D-aspartate) O-methyltransferase
MVTAAPEEVPAALLEQLALGGRMIVPIGSSRDVQKLQLITRTPECFQQKTLESVTFVPLIRDRVPR